MTNIKSRILLVSMGIKGVRIDLAVVYNCIFEAVLGEPNEQTWNLKRARNYRDYNAVIYDAGYCIVCYTLYLQDIPVSSYGHNRRQDIELQERTFVPLLHAIVLLHRVILQLLSFQCWTGEKCEWALWSQRFSAQMTPFNFHPRLFLFVQCEWIQDRIDIKIWSNQL